jgi:acetyl/propionyl-CoA carboxylase alpha subunit
MGIRTNVSLFRRILTEPEFLRGEIHTKWLDELLARPRPPAAPPRPGTEEAALIAAALWHSAQSNVTAPGSPETQAAPSRWKMEGRRQQMDHMP